MKKRIITLVLMLTMLLSLAVLSSCEKKEKSQLDVIKAAGVLKVGVKSDVPNFGLQDTATGLYEGFEIDLAGLIAKEILGDETKVQFTAVTAATRGPLIDTGDVDMVIATFTIKEDRKLSWNFTTPYYTDAVGLLVKTADGYTSLADLDGKKIGVATAATSQDALQTAADEIGISVTFEEFASYPEIKAALDSTRVDVFSVDRSILRGYLDSTTTLLDDQFSPQPYGIATKLTQKEYSEYIDSLIQKWLADGTIASLCAKYGI
ncbi:MAG: transporter substrate-binding domain-containing protein [Oscillospiraceae bacterium]|jgi:putative glutamine transport system substrate-binding protein|nr:transporter substrate-binding domain-containing protein [Oscillospiraceae bacterium]